MRQPVCLIGLALAVVNTGLVCAQAAPARDSLAEAIIFTPQVGPAPEDAEIVRWQTRAHQADGSLAAYEHLGWAFVAKARRTLDTGYYKLAEKTADAMDRRFGAGDESRLLRGHVLHNLHRFREAEALAHELCDRRGSPEDYALLSDALMEQGRLTESVAALQHMVNLRPGTEAYSRIAHLRWLKGDLPGAIAAMTAAEHASGFSEESAWTRVRLAGYYLQTGDADRALLFADSALRLLPDYAPALLARGRALLAMGRAADSLRPLRQAVRLNPLPEYQWWLADALRTAGQSLEAQRVESELRARGALSDPRTLALYLATRRLDPANAVALARDELANRADVFSHDALAWALFAAGNTTDAQAEMSHALAEQTGDARLFWHAGEIALACGHRADATGYFTRAIPLAATLTPGEHTALTVRLGSSVASASSGLIFPADNHVTDPQPP